MVTLARIPRRLDRSLVRLRFLPPLLARLLIGTGFYITGWHKLTNPDHVVEMFRQMGIPGAEVQAPFVACLEFYGGQLLILGLLVRPVAALLGTTMLVALLTSASESFMPSPAAPGSFTALAYLVLLVWLLFYGAGACSLDRAVKNWARRRTSRARKAD